MIRNPKYKFIEWKLILIYILLVSVGLIALSSVDSSEYKKQTIFTCISLLVGFYSNTRWQVFNFSILYNILYCNIFTNFSSYSWNRKIWS